MKPRLRKGRCIDMSLEAIRAFAEQYEAGKPSAPSNTGAQLALLEGGVTPRAVVWSGEDWATYQAIYVAVEGYHKRYKDMTGTLAEWTEALEDLKRTCRELGNAPLAVQLLSVVYGELERTTPPSKVRVGHQDSPAYAH